MKNYLLFLFLVVSSVVGCSCSHSIKQLDSQSAVAANDLTALMSGCGQQVTVGYLVCRFPEGSMNGESIYIHSPPDIECDEEKGCVYFKIFFPDGRPTYEGVVKKGDSFAKIPLSDITNKGVLDTSDRGFYGVSITLKYRGPGGAQMKTYSAGYLFLLVVKKDYVSLLENKDDENYVWSWKTPTDQTIKMTTGARVYVSPPSFKTPQKVASSKL